MMPKLSGEQVGGPTSTTPLSMAEEKESEFPPADTAEESSTEDPSPPHLDHAASVRKSGVSLVHAINEKKGHPTATGPGPAALGGGTILDAIASGRKAEPPPGPAAARPPPPGGPAPPAPTLAGAAGTGSIFDAIASGKKLNEPHSKRTSAPVIGRKSEVPTSPPKKGAFGRVSPRARSKRLDTGDKIQFSQ